MDSSKSSEHIFITKIGATDVACGLRRPPASLYVAIEVDGIIRQTPRKTVPAGNSVVEWDEEFLLPTDLSSTIVFNIYASFEMGSRLGKGALLRRFKTSVGEVLDRDEQLKPIRIFSPRHEPALSNPSLRITAQRRNWERLSESMTGFRFAISDMVNFELKQLSHDGHCALLRYRRYQNQPDLNRAIACLGLAIHRCPEYHPMLSAVQFNLANAMFVDCQANNCDLSLDTPIKLYRNTLHLRTTGHPAHVQRTLQLCLALLVRFQRRGDETDRRELTGLLAGLVKPSPASSNLDQAGHYSPLMAKGPPSSHAKDFEILYGRNVDRASSIRERRDMLRTLPHWDPRRPVMLIKLGRLLHRQFEESSNLIDIHEAISVLEQAVRLVPNRHPEKPGFLDELGSLLRIRFEQLGDTTDMERSISMLEEALYLIPASHHPNKPSLLNSMGNSLLCRFERLGNVADIMRSILMFEEAIHLAPDEHPTKPSWLSNLGNSLMGRFERFGDVADITKSVSMYEEAVHLTPDGHPDKPSRLHNLGNALSLRFGRLGEVADITKSISMKEEAVRLTPDGHLHKAIIVNDLGTALLNRFERLGDVADITKSVLMFEQAVCLTPDGHPDKPSLLDSLGDALSSRFERLGDVADMMKSISVKEKAIHLTPDGHPQKPVLLNNLGNVFSRRFECLGDVADFTKSSSMFEKAIHLTPDGHPDKAGWLNNMGGAFLRRFERLGDVADVTKSVSMFEKAIRLTPDGHPAKPRQFSNLGNALSCRFERLGDVADITKSILMNEEAVSLTADSHPDKPNLLTNLGNSLHRRFKTLGDVADITRSILIKEEAVRLTPDDHARKPTRLGNLSDALLCRFEHFGDVADIMSSVSMFEEATRLTPDGHSHKPGLLGSLANALSCRFARLGDIVDITKSISMNEEAVRLTPDDHPDKSGRFNNMGNALLSRFERFGDVADITQSVSMYERAFRLAPDGHPEKSSWLKNLGDSLMIRFKFSPHPSDLATATFHFSEAARCSTGLVSLRFSAARAWISSAQVEGNSQTLIDAYTTALDLLPQLAWIGLPLSERHRALVRAADVAGGAAGAALDAGLPEMAVEWLEQGRSIVWTQLLQLRTPVDLLRVTHPALADDFELTSRQLENASNRDHILSDEVLGGDSASHEKFVQRHHTLTLRREKLLADIRSLPGFDRFLLPKTISQLTALAHSGPVVYLNASKQRCDALIVIAERGSVVPVPLPGVTYRHVEVMQRLLLQRDYSFIPHDDVLLLTSSNQRNVIEGWDRQGAPEYGEAQIPFDRFQLVLGFLWLEVVHPVLEALGISANPSGSEKMTRIFWCPTGPFAFLPIHAAGLYGAWAAPGVKLSDFAISSYIPTLGALAPSTGKDASGHPSNIRLVSVPRPSSDGQCSLPNVQVEIAHIRALSAESQFVTLQDSDGTVEDVLEKMADADWVHFACHGVQDPLHPLDSGLCLANHRRLRLSDIIKLSRRPGGLAFLSACQTAKGDEKLSEESVHLAAGMLLAGYGSVIATMWSIMDNDAPKVARDVYKYLFRNGRVPDPTEAAEALHRAVVRLRDEDKVSFSSWVPFIHVGR